MANFFFVSDLHGNFDRYRKLFRIIAAECPEALFLGGDFLPSPLDVSSSMRFPHMHFLHDYLLKKLCALQDKMKDRYPEIFLILGNDDGRFEEEAIIEAEKLGVWHYVHNRKVPFGSHWIYGYSYIPPTPFLLKDWERYDVSRYVDPGCISPEEGKHSFPVSGNDLKYSTIKEDLDLLAGDNDLDQCVFLFHAPPHETALDRIASDGKMIDHVPLDIHVGSIAIRRFIEAHQPLLTLHGHIHESARLTGSWRDIIGRTHLFSAAHDGPELALIRFNLENPGSATRELV